jgi:hypothetical protein
MTTSEARSLCTARCSSTTCDSTHCTMVNEATNASICSQIWRQNDKSLVRNHTRCFHLHTHSITTLCRWPRSCSPSRALSANPPVSLRARPAVAHPRPTTQRSTQHTRAHTHCGTELCVVSERLPRVKCVIRVVRLLRRHSHGARCCARGCPQSALMIHAPRDITHPHTHTPSYLRSVLKDGAIVLARPRVRHAVQHGEIVGQIGDRRRVRRRLRINSHTTPTRTQSERTGRTRHPNTSCTGTCTVTLTVCARALRVALGSADVAPFAVSLAIAVHNITHTRAR